MALLTLAAQFGFALTSSGKCRGVVMAQTAYLEILAQTSAASVLAFAGLSKLVDGTAVLLLTLNASGWTDTTSVAPFIAPIVPYVEIALAVWLVSGVARTAALASTLALFSLFLVVLVPLGLQTGWGRACGCLGPIGATIRSGVLLDGLIVCLIVFALGWRIGVCLRRLKRENAVAALIPRSGSDPAMSNR